MIDLKLDNQGVSSGALPRMSNRKPPPIETRWKKGQSGNPGGVPKRRKDVHVFRQTTYEDFIDNLKYFGSLTKEEMQEDLTHAETTMFEHVFGKMVMQAADGDERARNELLNRLWGKPKEILDMSQIITAKLAMLSNEELIKLAKDSVKQLEGGKEDGT